jgi:hypothetical protein
MVQSPCNYRFKLVCGSGLPTMTVFQYASPAACTALSSSGSASWNPLNDVYVNFPTSLQFLALPNVTLGGVTFGQMVSQTTIDCPTVCNPCPIPTTILFVSWSNTAGDSGSSTIGDEGIVGSFTQWVSSCLAATHGGPLKAFNLTLNCSPTRSQFISLGLLGLAVLALRLYLRGILRQERPA